jgi:hypothetical protein
VQRADRAEVLADARQFQNRLPGRSRRYHGGPPVDVMMRPIMFVPIRRIG